MKAYELLYIVDPNATEEVHAAVMKRIETAITDEEGGVIDSVDDWGKRKLAYEINHIAEGDYILVNFHADPTAIAELDRVLRINDNVLRHMVSRRSETKE